MLDAKHDMYAIIYMLCPTINGEVRMNEHISIAGKKACIAAIGFAYSCLVTIYLGLCDGGFSKYQLLEPGQGLISALECVTTSVSFVTLIFVGIYSYLVFLFYRKKLKEKIGTPSAWIVAIFFSLAFTLGSMAAQTGGISVFRGWELLLFVLMVCAGICLFLPAVSYAFRKIEQTAECLREKTLSESLGGGAAIHARLLYHSLSCIHSVFGRIRSWVIRGF